MPKLDRRSFVQMITAAGLTPALPAYGARAAVAAPASATPAQMLWAGIQARAGSPAAFNGVAKTMGISGTAAQGIYAKALQSQALSGHVASTVKRLARQDGAALKSPTGPNATTRQPMTVDLDRMLKGRFESEDDEQEPDRSPDAADAPSVKEITAVSDD